VRHEIILMLHKQGAGYDLLGDGQLRVDKRTNEHLSDKRIEVSVVEFPRLDVMLACINGSRNVLCIFWIEKTLDTLRGRQVGIEKGELLDQSTLVKCSNQDVNRLLLTMTRSTKIPFASAEFADTCQRCQMMLSRNSVIRMFEVIFVVQILCFTS